METPTVLLFIGPICSGKSTLAKEAAKKGLIVINDDAVVMACHAGVYSLYSKKLKPLYKSIEMSMLATALSMGRSVVIDRPNMGAASRARFVATAKAFDARLTAVLFPNAGPEVHAAKRFLSDARGLPIEHWVAAARRHQSMWNPPTREEGFDLIVPAESLVF